jgi:8-amino-7-oxononanoate synthase
MTAPLPPHLQAWLASLQSTLDNRRQAHLLRELRPLSSPPGPTLTIDGREYLQFSSNNYLGLATDPEVIDAAQQATARFGTGSGASRLVAGSLDLHHQLETALARFKKTESALLFPTGFMANLAAITTFAGQRDLIVSDKLNHASLLDAAKFSGAAHRTFPHRRYARAAELLARAAPENDAESPAQKFLVTDSVFSMDGDLADLPAASALADQHNALLLLDDAHGAGVLGPTGAGLADLQNVSDIPLTVGTLSKALGSLGGFIAGPQAVIDTLINSARPFIYTTALPPACAAAALAALKITQRDPARRHRVLALADTLRKELRALDFDTGDSQTPIVPVLLGSPESALAATTFLRDCGLFIPAIRPPTVPPNTARLRISLMATHTDSHLDQLLESLRDLRKTLPPTPKATGPTGNDFSP